jgi:iron complex outermembrane recepter protein
MSKTRGEAYVAGVVAALLAVTRATHATGQYDTRLAEADGPAAPVADASVGGGLEEVIVTARKRAENIQDTPVSITALSADDLANRQVIAVQDLAAVTPSLAIQQSPYDILGSFVGIRGQQQTDLVITQTPPVGIYVDGVYYPTSLGTSLNNFEGVSQIEVLKGPKERCTDVTPPEVPSRSRRRLQTTKG